MVGSITEWCWWRRVAATLWLCCVVGFAVRPATGQEKRDAIPSPIVQQLMQRLDEQSRRIESLESELTQRSFFKIEPLPVVDPLQPVRTMGPTGSVVQDPAAGQEEVEGQESDANTQEGASDEDAEESSSGDEEGPGTIDERIARLEESVLGFEQLQEQEASFLESVSSQATRTVNGRIHLDYWAYPKESEAARLLESGDPNENIFDRFENRRARIGVIGRVPPENVSYRVEFEFSGLDNARLRDTWLGWDKVLFFDTIRVGNQKRPYSLDQLNSSNFNVFMERPMIAQAFNRNNRRLGIASFADSNGRQLNWNYGLYNLVPIQTNNRIITDRYQWEAAARGAWTWWYDEVALGRGYGHIGVSGAVAFPDGNAPNNGVRNNEARFRTRPESRTASIWYDTGHIDQAKRFEILGLESVLNMGSLQLGGEFMGMWIQRDESAGREVRLHGGYAYVSWFITGEHIPWNRSLGILGRVQPFEDFFLIGQRRNEIQRGMGAWQLAARYSNVDLNDADIFGGRGDSATVALNWYWNSHSRLQFNYLFGRIQDGTANVGGNPTLVTGSYQTVGMRFMIDF